MGWMRLFGVALLVLVSSAQAKTTLKKKVTADDEVTPTVEIELRPSWTAADNHLFSLNYADLGLKLSPTVWIGYQQQFITELQTPAAGGSYFNLYDGYVRAKFNRLWVDPDNSGVYFSFEPRVYFPTDPVKAKAGMVTQVFPYFKVTGEMTPSFSFTLKDAPVADFYNRDGNVGTDGKPKANPMFENWVVLSMDYAPPRGLVQFSLPIYFISTRYRDYATTPLWSHQFVLYPELTFVVDKHVFVGVAYESDDLVKLQENTASAGTWHAFLRTSF